MLYKVKVARDEYLGTPEEVVAWMAKAEGSPGRGADAFMRGVAERARGSGRGEPVEVSSPAAFLASLAKAGLATVEERPEASRERVAPSEALGDGPIAYGKGVEPGDVDLDALDGD